MLRERLQTVVDIVFAGNALAAAEASDMLPSTLHRILEGKVTAPRLPTVIKMADKFGVSFTWLIGLAPSVRSEPRSLMVEPYWLILMYHRRRQKDDREWIKAAANDPALANDREIKEIINHFRNFRLLPDEEGVFLRHFLPASAFDFSKPPAQREIEVFRNLARLETDFLALVVEKIKTMSGEKGKGPFASTSKGALRFNQPRATKK